MSKNDIDFGVIVARAQLVDGDFDYLEELIVKVEIIDFIPENA